MQTYEIVYPCVNTENYVKRITALVIEPDKVTSDTGSMLFTHGWGANRFQHRDIMKYACEKYNIVCISVEYRMSGYDFDSTTGVGAYLPYDASFFQTFDVVAGLRKVLEIRSMINRGRLFHYGGSQGGGIALLTSIFAPNTFAFVYASCPVTKFTEQIRERTGRFFADYEISVRDVIAHADLINCPLFLEHGTGDTTLAHTEHTAVLQQRLAELNKTHKVIYYEGGGHNLEPATTKLEAFKAMADEPFRTLKNLNQDDFTAGSIVTIDCGSKSFKIDWSKLSDSVELFSWE